MQNQIDTVVALIQQNGGEMDYRDIYEAPETASFRDNLYNVKKRAKATGEIRVLPVRFGEDGRMVSTWAIGGE